MTPLCKRALSSKARGLSRNRVPLTVSKSPVLFLYGFSTPNTEQGTEET